MSVVALIVAGLLAGALASALGIGGGVVFVPVLAVVLGLDQALAQGTSLAVIVPTAVIGTYGHARFNRIDWKSVVPVAIGGVIGAVLGAQIALAVDPQLLRRMFAGLLVVLAIRLIRQQLKAQAAAR
ncbi:MAG: sulfite exporter TauE/SafE family protein [Acidimicrobiia bacterium]|nr:sulfite exporter TauE/SafE family protein [Acidimicrobiia bacterium]